MSDVVWDSECVISVRVGTDANGEASLPVVEPAGGHTDSSGNIPGQRLDVGKRKKEGTSLLWWDG